MEQEILSCLSHQQQQSLWSNANYTCNNIKSCSSNSSGSLRKRMTVDRAHVQNVDDGDTKNTKKKKLDPDDEIEAKIVPKSKPNSSSKASVAAAEKTDYIHVRARRGQATDSHSLAERVRREKISKRMKYLQDLVPGCNHVTGKASVLDEIINYVQSLQNQVEFLSMKLAAVDPIIDCNMQSLLSKELNVSTRSTRISRSERSELLNRSFPLFNPLQQAFTSHSEPGVTISLTDFAVSEPVSVAEPCFDVCGSTAWDCKVQDLFKMEYSQGRDQFSSPFHLLQAEDNHM